MTSLIGILIYNKFARHIEACFDRKRTYVSGGVLVAEHVGVGGHDGRSRLFGHAGRLWRRLAVADQLLHGVRDAGVAHQPEQVTAGSHSASGLILRYFF